MTGAHASAFCFCALLAASLGAHDELVASVRKLRGWPAANSLVIGPSPEARIGAPMVGLNGALYLFGGATAMGECFPVAASRCRTPCIH
jgi:hypothetical protein